MADLIVSVPDNNCKVCKFNPRGTVCCELFGFMLNTDNNYKLVRHPECIKQGIVMAEVLEAISLLKHIKAVAADNPGRSKWSRQLMEYVGDLTSSDHYGKWGCLHPEQRKYMRNVAAYMDSQDTYIKQLQEEIAKLKAELLEAENYAKELVEEQ